MRDSCEERSLRRATHGSMTRAKKGVFADDQNKKAKRNGNGVNFWCLFYISFLQGFRATGTVYDLAIFSAHFVFFIFFQSFEEVYRNGWEGWYNRMGWDWSLTYILVLSNISDRH